MPCPACMVLLALVGSTLASPFDHIVHEVNRQHAKWTAAVPKGLDTAHLRALCGTILPGDPRYDPLPALETPAALLRADELPETFNWVEARPDCPGLQYVRDQAACGSCWAFAATEAFTDRRCVQYNDTRIFSVADTLGCCSGPFCGLSSGCHGGQPTSALKWMASHGVVTGAGFESKGTGQTCLPYPFAPCAHHVEPTDKYPACTGDDLTPVCAKRCSETGYATPYKADKVRGLKAYTVRGVPNIMADLYKNGPLSVAFMVYEDFFAYESGVYRHTKGMPLGGHAVELVGWGTEDGTPYWLIKNSWNEQWGARGYARIRRGVNECGIEASVAGILV